MNLNSAPNKNGKIKRPVIALLLSGLVLPGLGQLYLGRKVKGIFLVMAVNLLLLVSLFFIMKIIGPVISANLTGVPVTFKMVVEKTGTYSLWGRVLLGAFLLVWGIGIADIFTAFKMNDNEGRN